PAAAHAILPPVTVWRPAGVTLVTRAGDGGRWLKAAAQGSMVGALVYVRRRCRFTLVRPAWRPAAASAGRTGAGRRGVGAGRVPAAHEPGLRSPADGGGGRPDRAGA